MFTKKNIFLLVLGICISTNIFMNTSTTMNPLYKEYKWDFMEDIFVTKLNSTKSSFDKYDKLIQFGPMALSPLLLLLGVKSDEFVNVFISILTLVY